QPDESGPYRPPIDHRGCEQLGGSSYAAVAATADRQPVRRIIHDRNESTHEGALLECSDEAPKTEGRGLTWRWADDIEHMPIKVGEVEALFRYPVKSMSGELLEVADLGWHGLEGDRRLAFRRLDDRSGFPWLTASKLPELLLFVPERRGPAI